AEAARAVDADALGAEPHRRLHGAPPGAAGGDPQPARRGGPTLRHTPRTRRWGCCGIDSATSVASTSGLRTSTMLIVTSASVILPTSLRSFSMSAPFLPMTTHGRAQRRRARH